MYFTSLYHIDINMSNKVVLFAAPINTKILKKKII